MKPKKPKKHRKQARKGGRKAERLKIDGDWKNAVKTALTLRRSARPMTNTSFLKRLSVYAGLLCGAWGVLTVIWVVGGLQALGWVAGATVLALAIVWAIDVKRRADLELSRRAREADITRRENINRSFSAKTWRKEA